MAEFEELQQRAQARVGTLLKEKWHIDRVLGIGGMATVFAGTHRNKKRVAIKMLHAELSIDLRVRERFLREGIAANSVGHRGVVEVSDEDVAEDGTAFLVMELLEGETLEARRMRKGGRLPADQVLSLTDQILDVLAMAHDKGIVHRDLKPENLFYTTDRVLKVLDFGIARLREGAVDAGGGATRLGSVMGTPAFMAPEQARARWNMVDAQTDLWAVGATMFVLLTGRLVREAETANEELALAITTPVAPLRSVMEDAAPEVAALVDKALSYEKADRWSDARAMQDALRHAYAAMQAARAPEKPAIDPSRISLPAVSGPEVANSRASSEPSAAAAPAATTAPGSSTLVDAAGSRSIGPTVPAANRTRQLALGGALGLAAIVGLVVVAKLAGGGSGSSATPAAAPEPPETATAATEPKLAVSTATAAVTATPASRATEAPLAEAATATLAASSLGEALYRDAGPSMPEKKADAPKPPSAPVRPAKPGEAPTADAKKSPPPTKKADPFSRRD